MSKAIFCFPCNLPSRWQLQIYLLCSFYTLTGTKFDSCLMVCEKFCLMLKVSEENSTSIFRINVSLHTVKKRVAGFFEMSVTRYPKTRYQDAQDYICQGYVISHFLLVFLSSKHYVMRVGL
jgi:hypothetical protein